MRNALFVLVCLIPMLGCNLANLQNKNSQNSVDLTLPSPTPTSSIAVPNPANAPNANITTPKPSGITSLRKSVGKYPYEIKLLDNPDLEPRLQALMKKDLAMMKRYWNVESPLEISGSILETSGCEAHNCGGNRFVMLVDLDEDNINIYRLSDNHVTQTYFEKGKIKLPPKFAEEIGSGGDK